MQGLGYLTQCPNLERKLKPLSSPRYLQGCPTGLIQARAGPFLSTSPPIYCPLSFSGIYYYYDGATKAQKGEEIFFLLFLTLGISEAVDPESGAVRKVVNRVG